MVSLLAIPTKVSRFGNDAAGLEKLLRLLQFLSQIISEYSLTAADAATWSLAKKQFALGRRYLRFFKFIDCFNLVLTKVGQGNWNTIEAWLEVGKWSCLGIYFAMENCTILDAMGIWSTTWATRVFEESMRFWFYSLCCSLGLGVWGLWKSYADTVRDDGKVEKVNDERRKAVEKKRRIMRDATIRRMVVDGCDLFIPGYTTGWLVTTPVIVAMAGVVSTVLASLDIWERVQGDT